MESYDNFTAKNDKRKSIVPLVFGAIPNVMVCYQIMTDPKKALNDFRANPIFESVLMSLFLLAFVYFLYKFLDNKVKLIINMDGIWTYKFGQVYWRSIWYIYQQEIHTKTTTEKLIIKLNEDDKELALETTYFDKTEDEIISALKDFSKKFNIQFLGRDIV